MNENTPPGHLAPSVAKAASMSQRVFSSLPRYFPHSCVETVSIDTGYRKTMRLKNKE